LGYKEVPVTQLREMMLDELQRRNYAHSTVEAYVSALRDFAKYFKRPPDQLGPDHIRQFQLYLLRDRELATNTVKQRMAAIQFFFARTLKRPGRFPVSEEPAAIAGHLESRRSYPAHRFREQSVPPGDADDSLFDRRPPLGVGAPPSQRYRQQAHGDPRPAGQREQGP